MPILQTKKISKHFNGVKAADDLSVSFESGKITGLIGPNGSGKSTLLNLLSGLMAFDQGLVIVGGVEELKKIKPHEVADLGITRTFQEVRLFEQMPVLDNILVVITKRTVGEALFEKHKKFHLDKAEEVLKKVGLLEKKNDLAKNLSYGQRKLLEIARVLAMCSGDGAEGEIFLFDEPFAGLFPEMRKIVSEILKDLRQKGKTVVLIEHNMEIIRELCDHVFVLDSGKLLAEGAPDHVLAQKEVIEAYLGK
jgi:ABC-type branched-subunit amino acid transport system ATPase component